MENHPAPATDSEGNDLWNIWASKAGTEEFIVTAYSYESCMIVCNTMVDAGFTVLTDAI